MPLSPHPLASTRRTQLARWIAHPDNPLTWRVVVNRLWTHHFGNGLVRSPDNFGFTGERPTHPELLEWLSAECRVTSARSGSSDESRVSSVSPNNSQTSSSGTQHSALVTQHSLKRLHRQLITSATYRQSSIHPQQDEYSSRDAGNHLWWHAERRRLDAESLRDRMLFVGASLDSRMAGPGFKATIQAEALEGLSRKGGAWSPSPAPEQLRRSLYSYSARSLLPPLMTTFDFGDTTLPCGQRPVSTVAPQALALLNNAFSHERSTALARAVSSAESRVSRAKVEKDAAMVRLAWKLAFAREPSDRELTAARSHLAEQRQRFTGTLVSGSSTQYPVLSTEKPSSPSSSPPASPDAVPRPSALSPQPSSSGTRHSALDTRLSSALHLQADSGLTTDDDGRVVSWKNRAGDKHLASQNDPARRPLFVKDAGNGHAALRFDGQRRFLHLNGQVLTSQSFAIFAVVTDRATTKGHREIFSNWNGAAGNSGSSLFLGMTGEDSLRLSDDFSGVGHVLKRGEPFLLSGVNGAGGAVVRQNDVILASKGGSLAPRNLTTSYVIGQQGNIDGEYWHGDLFELLVFNNDLPDQDRRAVERYLIDKYHLPRTDTTHDPDFLALASLCHVLLNTNEFAYVD